MGKKCLKCSHEKTAYELSPDYECPNCGAIYAKVESALGVKQMSEGESRTIGEDSIEWRAIRWLAIITALYTVVFMLKLGEPDGLLWLPWAVVWFAFMYSPFLLLLKFRLA